jgi:phospholipid/cholesterol/gamma-HCH transport system permease protein
MGSAIAGGVQLATTGDAATISLSGDWTVHHVAALERLATKVTPNSGAPVTIDVSGVTTMDTAGVWVLRALRRRLEGLGHAVEVVGISEAATGLIALVEERLEGVEGVPHPERQNALERVGRSFWAQTTDMLALLAFIGEAAVAFGRQLREPRRIRWRMTTKIVEDAGVNALPIIGLLIFLLGVVVAYQGGRQLKIYGANIFIVEMVGLVMLRELAPLIAAIIVAGRTGSAFTAEIGTMRVTEEVDALETLGIGPFDQLVLPKVIGLMIAMPLLTLFADGVGVLGGMVMAAQVLDVSFADFLARMPTAVSTSDFVVGIVKAPVFALVISMVGCHQGFQVSGGADSVGRQTTVSVVQSIFLVIVIDAFFSILFSWMGV